MINALTFLTFLLLSTARYIPPIQRWLFRETGTDSRLAQVARLFVEVITGFFESIVFRLLLIAGGLLLGNDRLKDIDFVNAYGRQPQTRTAMQVATLPAHELPRFVRITDLVPTTTGVKETKSRYFIPTGKSFIYAADPAYFSKQAPDIKGELTVFVSQPYDESRQPEPGVARVIVGRLEADKSPDIKAEDIFREDGYTIGYPTRFISEGELPAAKGILYLELALLGLLALAQPWAWFQSRRLAKTEQ